MAQPPPNGHNEEGTRALLNLLNMNALPPGGSPGLGQSPNPGFNPYYGYPPPGPPRGPPGPFSPQQPRPLLPYPPHPGMMLPPGPMGPPPPHMSPGMPPPMGPPSSLVHPGALLMSPQQPPLPQASPVPPQHTLPPQAHSPVMARPESPQQELLMETFTAGPKVGASGCRLVGKNIAITTNPPVKGEDGTGSEAVKVTTITIYTTETAFYTGRLVAVSLDYIAYPVKLATANQWGIRVLNRTTSAKTLLKGHTVPLTDLAFVSSGTPTLASVDRHGHLMIHALAEANGTLSATMKLSVRGNASSEGPHHRLAWYPLNSGILAVADGTTAEMWNIAQIVGDRSNVEVARQDVKAGLVRLSGHVKAINSLAFAPDGLLLATASDDGHVMFWDLSSAQGRCAKDLVPHNGHPVTFIAFCGTQSMVTGADFNSHVALWDLHSWQCVQRVAFTASEGPSPQMHAEVDGKGDYLVLSSIHTNTLYLLAMENEEYGEGRVFASLREFPLGLPALSFVVAGCSLVKEDSDKEDYGGDEGDSKEVMEMVMHCVHTTAIQSLALRFPPTVPGPHDQTVPEAPAEHVEAEDEAQNEPEAEPEQQPAEVEVQQEEEARPTMQLEPPVGLDDEGTVSDDMEADSFAAVGGTPEVSLMSPGDMLKAFPPPYQSPPSLSQPVSLIPSGPTSPGGLERPLGLSKAVSMPHGHSDHPSQGSPPAFPRPRTPDSGLTSAAPVPPASPPASAPRLAQPASAVPAHATPQPQGGGSDVKLLAAIKEMIRDSEQRMSHQTERLLDIQWERIQEEREERDRLEKQRTEKLLGVITSTVQATVGGQLEAAVGRAMQAALVPGLTAQLVESLPTLAQNIADQVAIPVQDSVTSTLEDSLQPSFERTAREVLGKVFANKAAIDSIALAAAAALHKPLADAFAASINTTLVPAYEAATRSMFAQIKDTMDRSTNEYLQHVQQEVSVHGPPRQIQSSLASLQTSVSALQAVAEELPSTMQGQTATLQASLDGLVGKAAADMTEHVKAAVRAETQALVDRIPSQPAPRQHQAVATPPAAAPTTPPSTSRPASVAQQPAQAAAASASATRRASGGTASPLDAKGAESWQAINRSLMNEDYRSAFVQALSASNLLLVEKLCRAADVVSVLRASPSPLDQPVLMSLCQQLAFDLSREPDMKLAILKEAIGRLNAHDKVTRIHLPRILAGIEDSLKAALSHGMTNERATAVMALLQRMAELRQQVAA